MYIALLDIMLLHIIDYSVNITFICPGKAKLRGDFLYCYILTLLLCLSATKPWLSMKYLNLLNAWMMNRIIVSVWTRIENSVTLYAFPLQFPKEKRGSEMGSFLIKGSQLGLLRKDIHWVNLGQERAAVAGIWGRRQGVERIRELEYIQGWTLHHPEPQFLSV